MTKLLLLLGPPFRDRKSLETKQTQVKPNANRGWPIKLVNHIRPQQTRLCPNSSWTPTSKNADGAPPYWGFQHYASHMQCLKSPKRLHDLKNCISPYKWCTFAIWFTDDKTLQELQNKYTSCFSLQYTLGLFQGGFFLKHGWSCLLDIHCWFMAAAQNRWMELLTRCGILWIG